MAAAREEPLVGIAALDTVFTGEPPRGLVNMGNTCYLNSAIQALAHCPALVYYFHSCHTIYLNSSAQPNGEANPLVAAFAQLMQQLGAPAPMSDADTSTAIKPSELLQATQVLLPHFEVNAQQDSQELLRALLDGIHEALKRPLSDGELADYRDRLRVEWRACTGLEWKDEAQAAYEAQLEAKAKEAKAMAIPPRPPPPPPRPTTSPIAQLFEGQLLSAVKCLNCERISHTRDSFLDLSLSMPSPRKRREPGSSPKDAARATPVSSPEEENGGRLPGGRQPKERKARIGFWSRFMNPLNKSGGEGKPLGLTDALSAFFAPEELTGDEKYSCEHCKALQNGQKHLAIFRPPQLLAIHLKRFRFGVTAKKASDHVSFPLTALNLKPYCADSVKGAVEYDLAAVVTHHGAALSSGHYTAYVCGQNERERKWYHMDDSRVSEVNEERVLSSEAYMLFYKRRMRPDHKEFANKAVAAINRSLGADSRGMASGGAGTADKNSPELLVSRGWLSRFLTTDDPGAVAHSDVLCEHAAVDIHRGRMSLPQAHASCVRIPRGTWDDLVGKFKEGAPPAEPVPQLVACNACLELHKQELAALQEERDEISSLDSTEIQPGEMWYLLDALWLKHWREYCWDGTRVDPPGPVSNWRLLRDGRPRQNQLRARDYRGVNQKVWAVFMRRYGGGPAICRLELNLYAPAAQPPAPPYVQ